MSESNGSEEAPSRLARAVLQKNLKVRPGENVTIEAWPHTLPYAVALARETRRLKAFPVIHYEDEAAYWDSISAGETKVLGAKPGHEWASLAQTDVYIHMWGPGDRVRLNALPGKQMETLTAWNDPWYATARKAGVRGARLEIGRPYPTLASAYGVDQQEWTDQIVRATLEDPDQLARRAAPILRALQTGRSLHLTHDNGTDLTLGLARRPGRTYTGRPVTGDAKRPFDLLANLPSGLVRVALDELVADGTLVGNRTSYYDDGGATEPTFTFERGKLTEARFASGQERFDAGYAKGGKGRDQPGLFSVGLNPALHNTPQVEDIEAGAVLVSVGGNRNLGGKNAAPFFGWAVIAGADVEVDGKPLPPAA
jgi:leucyl aminopeptidase (aminopeptidase T)